MIRQLAALQRRALVSSQNVANLGLVRLPQRCTLSINYEISDHFPRFNSVEPYYFDINFSFK